MKNFWRIFIGRYQITKLNNYDDDKIETYRYLFSLDQDEVSEFKKNIDEAMLCELENLYYQPVNLTVFQKSFIAWEE